MAILETTTKRIATGEGAQASGTKGEWVTNPVTGIVQFFSEGTEVKFDSPNQLPSLSSFQNQQSTEQSVGISTSLPAINRQEIETKTKEQLAPSRTALEKSFEQRLAETKGLSEQEQKALEGQLGAKRRFSSS